MRFIESLKNRKVMTAVVIAAAVVLIALILLLSVRKTRAERFTGGEDTPYPYAWTLSRDGSVLVEPSGDVPEGYGWTVVEADASVAAVSEQEGPSFRLVPAGAGDSFFVLALAGREDAEDQICRLVMTVEVTGGRKPKAAVTGHRLELVEGILRGGEDFGTPYRIWTAENGELELRLTDSEGAEDWKLLERTPSVLRLAALRSETGRVAAELYSPAAGEAAFVLYSPSRGLSLEVSCRADEERNIRAAGHEMFRHENWAGREDGYADADVLAGTVAAPEGAENVQYGTEDLGAGIGMASSMKFTYLGYDWTLYLTASGPLTDRMEKESAGEEPESFFIPAGLLAAVLGRESVLAWCDTEERNCLLEGVGENIGREILLQTAAAVIPADE